MKRISLKSLELKAFRSFVEEALFEFPETGLRIIRGRNTETGGSSGAGKTSVILGPTFAMGYCPFPATELQSWFTEDKPFAAVCLRAPEHNILVQRGSGLKLTVGEEDPLKGKTAEARLTQELGLTPAMLSALTFREQRSAGTFLSKTNVEVQSFFTEVLALQIYERAYDQSQKLIATLEVSIQTAEGRLQVLLTQVEAALADLHSSEAEYKPLDRQPLEEKLAAARAEVEKWRGIRKVVQERRDTFMATAREAIDARTRSLREPLVKAEAEQQLLKEHLAGGRGVDADITRCQRRRQALEAQLREAATGICPTCKQPWERDRDGDRHSDAIDREYEQLGQELEKALAYRDQLYEVAQESQAKQNYIASLREDIAAAEKRASQEFSANLEALSGAASDAEAKTIAAEYQLNTANATLQTAIAFDKNAQTQLEFRQKRAAEVQASVAAEQQTLERLRTDVARERDFSALVGREGFLGSIFDEVLAEVAEETNAILARVPNVAHVTLAFKSETITGKGTVQRGIKPVVTVGGHEAALKSGCSGGMLGAVYLATDLAVIDVVSRRLGVSPGWLFLDESFEGLGPVEKEAYLEVLSLYAEKKLVLIIDHGTETKEALPGIDLLFKDGRTTIDKQ